MIPSTLCYLRSCAAVQKKNVLMSEWSNIKNGEEKILKQEQTDVDSTSSAANTTSCSKVGDDGGNQNPSKQETIEQDTETTSRPSDFVSFLYERDLGPVEFEIAKQIEDMRRNSYNATERLLAEDKKGTATRYPVNLAAGEATRSNPTRYSRHSDQQEQRWEMFAETANEEKNEVLEVAKRMEEMRRSSIVQS